jgi:hypothetical protein
VAIIKIHHSDRAIGDIQAAALQLLRFLVERQNHVIFCGIKNLRLAYSKRDKRQCNQKSVESSQRLERAHPPRRAFSITTGLSGRSLAPLRTLAILSTTSMPFDHAAKGGVVAIEEAIVFIADEELAARAIGIGRAGHRDDAPLMRKLVGRKAVGGEFAFDAIARSTRATMPWVAALNHEAFDDAVKGESIIETLFSRVRQSSRTYSEPMRNPSQA